MKKNSNLQELMGYAGGHRYLTYLSLLLSAISAILALFPFVFLFRIIQEVIAVAPNYAQATHIVRNGWMAVGFAVLSIVIYVCALMSSHLSAFRIAGNIRKALMAHIAELPLGFIGETGSGKIRRIVSDSSAATETYLAHQLPDMSAAVTTPLCMIVMLFLFDWRFGLVSLLPVILGFAAMFKMAGPSMAEDMKLYQNALADMNNEAVEYVRGVPVVKTFGQTVHSFKRFKGTIDSYYEFVMSYCKKCRPSMLSYTVLVNSAFAFLIVLALILAGGGPVAQPMLLNFIFYVIFTPLIATAMTKVMFMSENGMIVADAMSRIHSILDVEPLPEPRSGKVPTDNDIALENVTFRYTGGTTDALRDVTIRVGAGETVALVLRQLRQEQASHAISTYVFTQPNSPEPMHPQSPARYMQKFSKKYGVPNLHPHKLRHTFASIAITNGADVASVSEKLGHSDKAVTLRMYTHADQESMKRASQIFRNALKKAGQE